ncbi:MAG TPA: class I SAM-dependent methyltransferase [Spirochaetia bacterium]|nr:class I SAM-dependent methyltransferase [Spirochaetia bacterium]
MASGSWLSEVLFTAVETGLFTLLDPTGKSAAVLAEETGWAAEGTVRFLNALCAMGLLRSAGLLFENSPVARDYLVKDRDQYLGDLILWRRYLAGYWQTLQDCLKAGGRVHYPSDDGHADFVGRLSRYIGAMDAVARLKAREILAIFGDAVTGGRVLDVGAGSGAIAAEFLSRFPGLSATLVDLPEVLDIAGGLMKERGLAARVAYCPANILEPWPVAPGRFQLVILSNVIHVYAAEEAGYILGAAAGCLAADGLLLIHDFFPEHFPLAAALYDLNMFINTYNGRLFASGWVQDALRRLNLFPSALIPLPTDTGLVIASRTAAGLARLSPDESR